MFWVLPRVRVWRAVLAVVAVTSWLLIGVVPDGGARAALRPAISSLAARGDSAQTDAASAPCWNGGSASCASSDPQVTLQAVSTGDTSSCTFTATLDWGDKAPKTVQGYSGGPDGSTDATFVHLYHAPGTYAISWSIALDGGSCGVTSGTFQFTLLTPCAARASSARLTRQAATCSPNLAITSPPVDSVIALTDKNYLPTQPTAAQRTPADRYLLVKGTAKCAGPVVVTALPGAAKPAPAKVANGSWEAKVPLPPVNPKNPGPGIAKDTGPFTLTAQGTGCGTTSSAVTLVDLQAAHPTEDQALAITVAPAMPTLNATIQATGYPNDTSAVVFHWRLTAYGNFATRKYVGTGTKRHPIPNWDNPYEVTLATGTTTGDAQWQPSYQHVVGGIALLQVTATLPGVADSAVRSEPRWLEITGNGSSLKSASEAYTASHMASAQDATTLDKIMGCAESNWKQFAQGGAGGAQTVTGVAGAPADMPGLSTAWWPKFGAPAGIGIAQIDPAGGASWPFRDSPYEYGDWDWQANLASGITLYNQKLAAALRWRANEQGRLASRLSALITLAKKNRAGRTGSPFPALVTVPAMTESQLLQDTIRQYNGGHQFYFDADYILSANGLNVLTVGTRAWKDSGTYGGTWGKPASPTQRRTWLLITTKGAANYVTTVWNCQS